MTSTNEVKDATTPRLRSRSETRVRGWPK